MSNTDKIFVAGDWHGNTPWAVGLVKVAKKYGCTHIVQCGDFGIWTHVEEGVTYLDALNDACRKYGVKIYFVGGNHENWDHLEAWMKINPKNYTGNYVVRSHIFFIPDGNRWMWSGKWFMGVGGAVSVDKDWRLHAERTKYGPRTLWWDQEQLDESVLFKLEQSKVKTDYLFTHDCPTNAPFYNRMKDDPQSQMHRQLMDRLGKAVRPKMWFHGHMHDKYDGYDFPTYESHTKVYGLTRDTMQDNWGILDTATGDFKWQSDIMLAKRRRTVSKPVDDNF